MRRSDFSDAEITAFVREIEAGRPAEEVALVTGTSLRTLYRWRRRFGGLKPFAVRALRDLEQENHRLRIELTGSPSAKIAVDPVGGRLHRVRSDMGDGRGRLRGDPPAPPTVVGRFPSLRVR